MATNPEVDHYVRQHYGFTVKSCWIAHVKELNGILVPPAWNRAGKERQVPCPPAKRAPIESALRHFGMI